MDTSHNNANDSDKHPTAPPCPQPLNTSSVNTCSLVGNNSPIDSSSTTESNATPRDDADAESKILIALLDQRFTTSKQGTINRSESNKSEKSGNSACTSNLNEPFGLASFSPEDRKLWGESIRVAMACINSSTCGDVIGDVSGPQATKPPHDKSTIADQLKSLTRYITSNLHDQIQLLVRFDDLQGWEESGCKHCVAWMNKELSISSSLAWEYLRVGRELRNLPVLSALFKVGSLGWSKVRQISRVADQENECLLCHAALDASVSDVERICREYHWQKEEVKQEAATANARAMQQFHARSLTWRQAINGNTEFRLCLPPESAQAFLRSIEHSLEQLTNDETTEKPQTSPAENNELPESPDSTFVHIRQRRADAAVLMAEKSLLHAGRDICTADRFQVVISIDANELGTGRDHDNSAQSDNTTDRGNNQRTTSIVNPPRRPIIDRCTKAVCVCNERGQASHWWKSNFKISVQPLQRRARQSDFCAIAVTPSTRQSHSCHRGIASQ